MSATWWQHRLNLNPPIETLRYFAASLACKHHNTSNVEQDIDAGQNKSSSQLTETTMYSIKWLIALASGV